MVTVVAMGMPVVFDEMSVGSAEIVGMSVGSAEIVPVPVGPTMELLVFAARG